MQSRVTNEVIDIDDGSVKHFFEERAKKQLPHRYNYAIYQDDNPELAIKRDAFEKELILGKIEIGKGMRILDIGCGVGRWADAFINYDIDVYVGTDICSEFLNIAKESLIQYKDKCRFVMSSFLDVLENLKGNDLPNNYDLILVNGVFLYINDSEIETCLNIVKKLLDKKGKIYIKDAIGIDNRLTLKDYWSAELKDDYSAIYRTLYDWEKWIQDVFDDNEYHMVSEGSIWPKDMRNRSETEQYYWILERK